jgi:hypothetical protein
MNMIQPYSGSKGGDCFEYKVESRIALANEDGTKNKRT